MTPERMREIERLFHEARAQDASRARSVPGARVRGRSLAAARSRVLAGAAAGRNDRRAPWRAGGRARRASPAAARARLVGRSVSDRATLGVGGMGEVYRARDTTLSRDVAIKILPRHFTADPERLARFEREARVLAALNHPNIGAIYGLECSRRREGAGARVGGRRDVGRSDRARTVPVRDALTIARQVVDALDAAHEKGIVHRDLKPANIKVTPDGVVKVLDFGLAKAAGEWQSPTLTVGSTQEGTILGTAAYMSPEQARGQAVDKRTDIWAFGCVLYEMLTGTCAVSRRDGVGHDCRRFWNASRTGRRFPRQRRLWSRAFSSAAGERHEAASAGYRRCTRRA